MPERRKIPENVDLRELLNIFKREILLDFNCHAVGIIETFNDVNQTATVSIAYKKTLFDEDNNKYLQDYPVVVDCPVIVLGGGKFSLKMPIARGDECLLLFADRNIDGWFESGQVKELEDNRLHAFPDAIALVGLRSMPRALNGYEADAVVLGDGTHELKLGNGEAALKKGESEVTVGDKITIKNQLGDLGDILTKISLALTGLGVADTDRDAAIIALFEGTNFP